MDHPQTPATAYPAAAPAAAPATAYPAAAYPAAAPAMAYPAAAPAMAYPAAAPAAAPATAYPAAVPAVLPVTLHTMICAVLTGAEQDPSKCTAPAMLKVIRTNPTWAALTKTALNHELYEGERTGAFVKTQGVGGPPTWSINRTAQGMPPGPGLPPGPRLPPAPRFAMAPEVPSVSLEYFHQEPAGISAYMCLPEVVACQTYKQITEWLESKGAVPFERVIAQAIATPGMVMPDVARLYIVAIWRKDAETVPQDVACAVLLAQKICRYGTEILECQHHCQQP